MTIEFLILSVFFPRIMLFVTWMWGQIPLNNIPFIGDLLLSVLFPRVLITVYIATTLGTDSAWFWIHGVLALISFLGVGYKSSSEVVNKR